MKRQHNTLRVSIFLAKRGILHGSKSVFLLSSAVITLLYINLLFIPSLMQGASQRVDTLTRQTLTSDIIMTPVVNSSVDDAATMVDELSKYDGVFAATSTYQVGNKVISGDHSASSQIFAIDPDTYSQVFQNTIINGSPLSADSTSIAIGVQITGEGLSGYRYDTSLQSGSVGDVVTLQLQGDVRLETMIGAVINNGFKQADSRVYIASNVLADKMPLSKDRASAFYVKLDDPERYEGVLESLRNDYPEYRVELGVASTGIDDQVGTINLISAMLGIISLVVAAIMIFTVTYVDLTNRRRLIGIQRAIGVTTMAIQLSYILRTTVAVAIGLIVGALLYVFALIPLSRMYPFSFPNGPVSLVMQYSLMIKYSYLLALSALIATLVPTMQILRAKLVDVIWGR